MNSAALVLKPACIKTLSQVEVNPNKSNQHEFNGVSQLKSIFDDAKKEKVPATFSIRGADVRVHAWVTWYDARKNHPTRSEHRLYFPQNTVMSQAKAGDNILIGYDRNHDLHVILIPSGTFGHALAAGWVAAA